MEDINVLIFGSTGMVGKGVLLECLEDENVARIFIVNRYSSGVHSGKVKEFVCKDLFQIASLNEDFKDSVKRTNACFFSVGVSSAGMTEEKYTHLTYDLTVVVAEYLKSINSNMAFFYVSGAGTDSSEKGRIMWARVKGKTENALLSMGFLDAYMFRPGFIQPMKGVKSKTALYQVFYVIFRPLYFLLRNLKSSVTSSPEVGRAMLRLVQEGYDKKIVETVDINQLASR